MTTDEQPVLCLRRLAGSWIVQVEAVSVADVAATFAYAPGFVERLVSCLTRGVAVHDGDDADGYVFYLTDRPDAVVRQWQALRHGSAAPVGAR